MKIKILGSITALGLLSLTLLASPCVAQPVWTAGNTYDMNEVLDTSFSILGGTASLFLSGQTHYTVMSQMSYMGYPNIWQVVMVSSPLNGSGTADIPTLGYNGPIQLAGGLWTGSFYVTSDLQTLAEARVITGTVSISGFPVPLTIDLNQSFSPPLKDIDFPPFVGDSWNENITFTISGSLSSTGLFNSPLNTTLPTVVSLATVGQQSITTVNGTCDTYHNSGTASNSTATADTWYCPAAGWFLENQTANIPLGAGSSAGSLKRSTRYVSGYNVTLGSTPTPEPTNSPTQTPNGTPFVTGEVPAANATDVAIDSQISLSIVDYGVGINQSSISFLVDDVPVTPTITGNPAAYHLTYLPAGENEGEIVSVSVGASDLDGVAMPAFAYSYTLVSYPPPFVADAIPAPDASGVAADTQISFTIEDTGPGVNESSILLEVSGQTASGSVVSPIISGSEAAYYVKYKPASQTLGEVVQVIINAKDTLGGIMPTDKYSYTILGAVPTETGTPIPPTATPVATATPTQAPCTPISYNSGWNSLGFPVNWPNPTPPKMETFIASLKADANISTAYVAAWSGTSWSIHQAGLPVNNLTMTAGKGYLYYIKTGHGTWNFCGEPFAAGTTYNLNSGWNYLSLECYSGIPTFTAQSLSTALNTLEGAGTCLDVAEWTGTGWKIFTVGLPVNNFTLNCSSGYFIRLSKAVSGLTL